MAEAEVPEVLVSVDVETSGQSPSVGSLLSIGACLVDEPAVELYLELKPLADRPWSDEAEAIHKLDRSRLEEEGLTPETAMERFAAWLIDACGRDSRPVFVGFNSPFDWMFVADYFWRYLGRNPFGVSALDLKSYYMGREHVTRWSETRRVNVDRQLRCDPDHSHHALDDARGQAAIARVLLGRE
ncbi:MAG: 3'-5' exonuclease [Chloroflexota bacterium]